MILLAACSAGAEPRARMPLAPGQGVEISYQDGSTRLTLRDADSVDDATYREQGLYGNTTPDVKFADRGSMQALVDALYELGHFAHAEKDPKPGAKTALRVRIGDQVTVWSQPSLQPENITELERFNTARLAFLQVHNNIISYHASRMSTEDFERAIAEQNEKNRAAVRSLLDKAGKGGR